MSEFAWQRGKEYQEIIYETLDGIAKITINRPERRNAFTPLTAVELYDAFTEARDDAAIGVVLLTGANRSARAAIKRSAAPADTWAKTIFRA